MIKKNGNLEVDWKHIISRPNEWIINEEKFFDNGSSFTLQVKFLVKNDFSSFKNNSEFMNDKKSFKVKKKIEGFLNFNIIECSDIHESFLLAKKLYLEIFFSDDTKKKVGGIVKENKIIFNEEIKKKVFFEQDKIVNFVFFKLYEDNGILSKKKLIGDFYLDFQEALNLPENSMGKKYYFLTREKKKTNIKLQIITQFSFFKEDNLKEIKGKLKIKIHRARNLVPDETEFFSNKKKIDPYFKINLQLKKDLKLNYKTKTIKNNSNPIINEETIFEINLLESKNLYTKKQIIPNLYIELYDKDIIKDDYSGGLFIDWIDCFENPGRWEINNFFEIKNKKNEIKGEIYISLCFIPDNFLDRNICCPDIDPVFGKDLSLPIIRGCFMLKILFLIDLKFIENGILQKDKELNPFLEIKMPNEKEFKTKTIKKNEKYIDNSVYIINNNFETEFNFENINYIKNLKIFIKNKSSLFSSDKIISSLNLPIKECINFPGKWVINSAFYLLQNPEILRKIGISDVGRIYLQARFIPDKMISDSTIPQISSYFSNFVKEEKIFKGKILINLIHCKDLPIADIISKQSDPFVNFILKKKKNGEKKKKFKRIKKKSRTVHNNLNPIFDEIISLDFEIEDSEIENLFLKIEVYDEDNLNNDFLGDLVIDSIKDVIYNKNKWSINKIYNLSTKEKKSEKEKFPSQIYLQMIYLEEGVTKIGEKPEILEDLSKNIENFKKEGFIYVDFKHCKGLPKVDKNRNSVDPYLKLIFFENDKKKIIFETSKKKNINCPLYNEKIYKEINTLDFRKFEKIKIEVWDQNSFLSKNELIGIKIIKDFQNILFKEKKNKWGINKIYNFEKPSNFKKNLNLTNFGSCYIKIGFLCKLTGGTELEEENEKILEDYEKILKLSNLKGNLIINLSHARNLLGKDEIGFIKKKEIDKKLSDPYVIIKINNRKKIISKKKKKTVNPIWGEEFKIDNFVLDYYNSGKIKIEIYDKDNFLNSDDLLGFLEIDLKKISECYNNWGINKYFKIEGKDKDKKKFTDFGDIYFQIGFFENEILPKPEINEDLMKLEKIGFMDFDCKIKLEHVINIPMEKVEECSSSYYIKTIFPNLSEINSKIQKNTYHPIFDEKINKIMCLNPNSIEPLKFEIYKKCSFLKKDVLIGKSILDSENLICNINKYSKNGYINFYDENENMLNTKLYIKIGFFENGNDTKEIFEPILENSKMKEILINGKLIINILNLFDLDAKDNNGFSDPFCEIIFGKEKYKTEINKKCLECEINQKLIFDIKKDYFSLIPKLIIKIWDYDTIKNDLIGQIEFDIIPLYQNKKKWIINKIYDIKKNKKNTGKIYLQGKFTEENISKIEKVIDFPESKENIKNFIDKKKQGKIIIGIIHCKNLIPEDGKTCDPFIELKLNNKKKKTKVIKKNINPVYKEKIEYDINLRNGDELTDLEIRVYDHDLIRNDLIGLKNIDIKEIFDNKNNWGFNKILKLDPPEKLVNKYNNFGSVYLQVKFVENNFEDKEEENNFAPFLEKIEEILEKENFDGKILINLIHARNLLKSDRNGKSDPFVIFEIDDKKVKSKVLQNTLYPEFNQELEILLDNKKISDLQFLNILVKDEDTFSSELIGSVKIDINSLFKKKDNFINKIFKLEFPDKKIEKKFNYRENAGFIYIQLKLLKKGDLKTNFNYEKIDFIKNQFINGILKLELKNAKNLINRDGSEKDLSDPYTIITIPSYKKSPKFKSKVFKNNLNPNFNEIFEFKFENVEKEFLKILKIEVKDQDFGFDDSLGVLEIDLDEVFQFKGKSVYDGDFLIKGDDLIKKFNVRSLGTLGLKLTYI